MKYLVWIGPRDTDVKFNSVFDDSICYYSKSNKCNIRKAHIYGSIFIGYISSKMSDILEQHKEAQFVFYNPKIAYSLPRELAEHVICLNSNSILNLLSDKIHTKYWLGNYVPVLPAMLLDSCQISIETFKKNLGNYDSFVIQQNRSSGGFGTFHVSDTTPQIIDILKSDFNELFIISPYIENSISLNVNAVIYKNDFYIFTPSIQIVKENKNRLIYYGADYKATQMLSNEIISNVKEYSKMLLKIIQTLGYRGIIGIDFLVKGTDIFFQEINPRYQASSFLLDQYLKEHELITLSEMNINAFSLEYEQINYDTYDFCINSSFYKYLYETEKKHLYYVENIARHNKYVKYVCMDGFYKSMKVEEDAYCYSIIFSTNITSPNVEGGYNLHSNIEGEEDYIKENINSPIGLKIALINQGCVIDCKAMELLEKKGAIKKATFSAIDFQLDNGVHINAPVNLRFIDFSPFIIGTDDYGSLVLKYYNKPISLINVEMQPEWCKHTTKNGITFERIAYLSTDRLRIKHEPVCEFKKLGVGCFFCGIPCSNSLFSDEDICEVIKYLVPTAQFRHVLIGGGSGDVNQEYAHILFVANLIHQNNPNLPIYLMSLPPNNTDILKQYTEVGITEVAFNIEIWDRELAKKIMPGKGNISIETYLNALTESTKIWGTNGDVRTALIVGLNDKQTMFDGIRTLCENGIQPMLSVFRPMPKTKLELLIPPSNSYLLSCYSIAQNICKKYNLMLGPTCDACKNNMLAI